VTTVLICAGGDLESELSHTLFWRDDLERYVAPRADEARMLALVAEPNVVVIDMSLPGADTLVTSLRAQPLPHPVSIVALGEGGGDQGTSVRSSVDAILPLPPGPEWDDRLVQVLQVPTRKQARFDISFEVVTRLRQKAGGHHGLALNMSSGGILLECANLSLQPGDDVELTMPIPGLPSPVEGRARVVRQPNHERLGLRFEAFSGNGDVQVRDFLAKMALPRPL
jgi:PilZ domain